MRVSSFKSRRGPDSFMSDCNAEMLLHESALAAAPYGAFICAADGRFRYVKAAYEQLTGYRADELIGRRCFDSLHDPAELRGGARNCRASEARAWGHRAPGRSALSRRPAAMKAQNGPTYGAITPASRSCWPSHRCLPASRWQASNFHAADEPVAFYDGAQRNPAGYVGIAVEMTRYAQSEARLCMSRITMASRACRTRRSLRSGST